MSDADRTTALVDALLAGARRGDGQRRDGGTDRDGVPDCDGEPRVVEIGIGERTTIAEAIAARGVSVLATDVVERSVPEPIEFEVDDLLSPDRTLYDDADLLYALRLPPELHDAFAELAADVGTPAGFTTLGGDPPAVPIRSEQLPGGETIHWIERGRGAGTAGVESSSGDE